jgi:hypothetical protein
VPATIIDTEVLAKLVAAALAAGIGITAVFGLVIYGSTRFSDLRREGNAVGAAVLAVFAVAAFLVFAAAVALGLAIMLRK